MADQPRIAVTGGSGKLGRAVVADLIAHGYSVLNLDRLRPPGNPGNPANPANPGTPARPGSATSTCPMLAVDLTDFGQTVDALRDCGAVIHLAAIPAPGLAPDQATFANNTLSTYNVFLAAKTLGIRRVVQASSETTLGLPLDKHPPAFAPITEADPLNPRTSYAHAKVLAEEMGRYFFHTAGITSAALRFSNVMEPHDYARFEAWQDDPRKRIWNLWGYIDARDGATACRLALEADDAALATEGPAPGFIIANGDTVMREGSAALLQQFLPGVKLRELPHDRATLLSIDKARRVLGFEPAHDWLGR